MRTLEGNSRKSSESVSGAFPEFIRNFLRKVPAVVGVWPANSGKSRPWTNASRGTLRAIGIFLKQGKGAIGP